MENFYEHYDRPPGPDRISNSSKEHCSPTYLNNGGFNISTADDTYCDFSESSKKRRSWQDMVEQQSTSDVGSFNSSYSTVMTNCEIGKRRSWDKLIESDENLQKHDQLVVSILPEPLQPISLMMVNEGRLGRVHLYNKKQKRDKHPSVSSKTSTPSEFILVPKPFSFETVTKVINDQQSSKNSGKQFDNSNDNAQCDWPARRTTFALIATLGLCIFAGLIGYFAHKLLDSQNNFSLNFSNTKENFLNSYNLNVLIGDKMAVLSLNNSFSKKEMKTFVDFENKLLIYQPQDIGTNYCIVKKLNTSNLPHKEALKSAAALSAKEEKKFQWSQDWYYKLEVDSAMRDIVNTDNKLQEICVNSNNVYLLQSSSLSQQGFQCYSCNSVCVPEYAVIKLSDREWALGIIQENCFWFSPNGLPQLFTTTQAPLRPFQNSFQNNNKNIFYPSQQQWFPQQQTYQLGQSSLNINNQLFPSMNTPNGAFWFNGNQRTGR